MVAENAVGAGRGRATRITRVSLFLLLMTLAMTAGAAIHVPLSDPGCEGGLAADKTGWNLAPLWHFEKNAGLNGSGGLVWENSDTGRYACVSQIIKLNSGVRYRFEALVYLENFRGSNCHGVSMGIEWVDAKGKCIGGDYAQSVTAPFGKWVRIAGATPKIPKKAVSARLVAIVCPGCTGRVVFDNFDVAAHEVQPVVGVYSSVYRDIAASGRVGFTAVLALPDGLRREDAEAVFCYRDAEFELRRRPADRMQSESASVELAVNDLAMGEQDVVCELRRKGGSVIGTAACRFTHVTELPSRRVFIDEHRRVILDGKPFFPFGMYFGTDLEHHVRELDIYAKGPFNSILPFQPPKRAAFDLLSERKLMGIFACAQRWYGSPRSVRNGHSSDLVADRVFLSEMAEWRNHPAFLAYYTADESALPFLDGETHIYALIRQYDPDHPAWSVCASFGSVRDFLPAYDIVGTDLYPIGRHPMRHVTDGVTAAVQNTFSSRSVWQVGQAFSWSQYKTSGKENVRFPTEAEYRNMTWQHIAGGANGLFYFMFSCLREKGVDFDSQWAALCTVGEEVKRLTPVILSVEPAPSVTNLPENVVARTWVKDGDLYVVLVEIGERAIRAAVGLSWGNWSSCTSEIGPAQSFVAPDRLTVDLPALGVALLRFGK